MVEQEQLDGYSPIPALKKNHRKIRMKQEAAVEVQTGVRRGKAVKVRMSQMRKWRCLLKKYLKCNLPKFFLMVTVVVKVMMIMIETIK